MLNPLRTLAVAYQKRELRIAEQSQRFTRINERPAEYAFAFRSLNALQPTTVLDVGTGRTAFPALLRTCGFIVTATDSQVWPRARFNPHWHVADDDIQASRLPTERYDAITCISVIEHLLDGEAAMRSMHKLLKPGGTLILTTPFGSVGHENVYTLPGSYGVNNSYPCRQSTPSELEAWLGVGFQLRESEYWQFFEGTEYWSCGSLLRPPRKTDAPAHLGCFVFTK